MMLNKTVNILDALIFLLAILILRDLDFNNLTLFDKVYIATFGIWLVLFAIRIVIIFRTRNKSK